MTAKSKAETTARVLVVSAALLLPALTLIPLGSLWLWERGLLIYWALGAFVLVSITYLLQLWLFAGRGKPLSDAADGTPPDPQWSELETQAWSDVQALARGVDIASIDGRDDVVTLGQKAIDTVARRLHPNTKDPLWQFTVPEALLVVERVSRRLRQVTNEKVPFGDKLTVSQVLTFYRWRGAVDYAEKAYDVWRVVRLANPIAAATQEAREKLSRAMYQWGRDHIARRLIETYVEEVGRSAIDLYGGRLKEDSVQVTEEPPVELVVDGRPDDEAAPDTAAAQRPTSRRVSRWRQIANAAGAVRGVFRKRAPQ